MAEAILPGPRLASLVARPPAVHLDLLVTDDELAAGADGLKAAVRVGGVIERH